MNCKIPVSPFSQYCFIFVLFMFGFGMRSQELPPVTNFTPNSYNAGNQNWMISQTGNGNMYVANGIGLLEYTGADWNIYPMPNHTTVRSVKAIGEKIFTGAYMELGYWTRNTYGLLEYTSLIPRFPRAVRDGEQFWHMEKVNNALVIQSFQGLYIYDMLKDELSVLDTPTDHPVMSLFKIDERVYFVIGKQGLFTIEKGRAEMVIPNEVLAGLEIVQLLPGEGGIRLLDRSGKIFQWNGEELQPILESLYENIEGISVFSATTLKNGNFLLGSVENGLYHVNRNGDILHHFKQENGLQNNTVLTLFVDEEENIWTGLDNGLSVINLQSSYTIFQDNVGQIGTVYTSFKKGDFLYLGTNQGLYFKQQGSEEISFVEGTNGQVWSLQMLDDLLFCGHNNGTFLINEGKARKISDRLGTWSVVKMLNQEDTFIQGHYNGISFIHKQDSGYVDLPLVKGFPHSSKHIVSDPDGDIWVGNEHKGVFRLRVDDSLGKLIEIKNYSFDRENGITSSIFKFEDKLFYATKDHIFQYDPSKDRFTKKNKLNDFLRELTRVSGKMIPRDGDLWGFGEEMIFNVRASDLAEGYDLKSIFIPKKFRSIPVGYENVSRLDSNRQILGLVDGYLMLDGSVSGSITEYPVRINRVARGSVDENFTPVSLDEDGYFSYESNNVNIDFGVPEYEKFLVPLYRYRLVGLSSHWSPWRSESTVNFKNLPFGAYEFQLQAKLGDEILPTTTYLFKIARPWYLGNWAIAGYFLLLLLLLFLTHLAYKRDREKRIRENAKELRMKNLEAEQKIIKLQNEQLEKEMAGKSKELAVSTMSLIKKNEFLSNIKQKLEATGDSKQVRSVIKTIDQDISEEDNWKFFKKAFSNADKEFFGKVKEKHPDLTSNDLKLCAYLRLNLSSKEIAPLLNISVKSVEIKRYRLRKKMGLARDINLVDYILAI